MATGRLHPHVPLLDAYERSVSAAPPICVTQMNRSAKEKAMRLKCFHRSDCSRDYNYYKSRSPKSLDELNTATQMILGHFTSSSFLDGIAREGLIPDTGKVRAIDDRVSSDDASVYLTARYDLVYLTRAVANHGGRPIVVEVLVDCSALVADEGALSPADAALAKPDEALYLSLCLGSCKHSGPIPLSAILSITEADGTMIYEREQLS